MRTQAAYVRSLGTTSILVAAALLMLGVVSALVGFHRWPDGGVGQAVPSVPLNPSPQPVLRLVRSVSSAPTHGGMRRAAAGRAASTRGLVKVSAPRPVGSSRSFVPGRIVSVPGPLSAGGGSGRPSPGSPLPGSRPSPGTPDVGALVQQIIGSIPHPPGAGPGSGQQNQVNVPLLGTVNVPSGSSR